MANRVLLALNEPGGSTQVAVNNHVYDVVDGFCLVDVTPYAAAGDRKVDAVADATEICRLPGRMYGPPLFRAASPAEVTAWQARQAKDAAAEQEQGKLAKTEAKTEKGNAGEPEQGEPATPTKPAKPEKAA